MAVDKYALKLEQLKAPLLANGIEHVRRAEALTGFNGHVKLEQDEQEERPEIVQFSTDIYYADEGEGEVIMEVTRNGPILEISSVDWYTKDASARSGEQYVASHGTVHFEVGDISKQISVPIIQDERYNPTKEFKVFLSNPRGCEVGLYLNLCRVKIIDDDVFPSNNFEGMTTEENMDKVPPFALMKAFLWICFGVPGVGWRSVLVLLINQWANVYYLLKTWLLIYMVDTVFDTSSQKDLSQSNAKLLIPNERGATVMTCALLWLVPFGVQHVLDIAKVKLDVSAKLRGWLQMCLFSKYLTYTDKERHLVEPAAMSLAVLEQSDDIVSKAYMKFWALLGLLGKLIIVIAFMLKESPSAIYAVLIFPTLMGIWIVNRSYVLERISDDIEEREKELMFNLQTACRNYFLISEYNQRPKAQDQFDECVDALNEAKMPMELAETNNTYVPGWISTVAVFFYILFMGNKVLEGHLGVGVFIAMVKILNELGDEFKEAYEMLMDMLTAVGPLKRITIYINGETDLPTLKEASLRLREETLSKLQELAKEEMAGKVEIADELAEYQNDRLRLEIRDLQFSYGDAHQYSVHAALHDEGLRKRHGSKESHSSHSSHALRMRPWSLQVEQLYLEQGTSVAVLGKHKSGQKTFIRLLAKLLSPVSGHLFIPSHLRVLHVSRSPHILEHGLVYNLNFGLQQTDLARTKAVVETLALSPGLQDQLELELSDAKELKSPQEAWRLRLSYTDICWIHLARALVVNPEVLILERPVVHFDEHTAERVMKLLQEFVRNRGVSMDPGSKHLRRPRTVIFSTIDRYAEYADRVWRLDLNGGVTRVEEDRTNDATLHAEEREKSILGRYLIHYALGFNLGVDDEEESPTSIPSSPSFFHGVSQVDNEGASTSQWPIEEISRRSSSSSVHAELSAPHVRRFKSADAQFSCPSNIPPLKTSAAVAATGIINSARSLPTPNSARLHPPESTPNSAQLHRPEWVSLAQPTQVAVPPLSPKLASSVLRSTVLAAPTTTSVNSSMTRSPRSCGGSPS